MTRLLIGSLLLLLLLAAPCGATSYRKVSTAELVGSADVIVVARVTSASYARIGLRVERPLAGKVERHVSIPAGRLVAENPGRIRAGDVKIFFLRYRKQELALVYDFAFRSKDSAEEVGRLIDMRVAPSKYLADPQVGASPAFLEVVSYALGKRERVGDLDRAAVVEHFEDALGSPDSGTVVLVLDALERVGSKRSAEAVRPLLRHEASEVRQRAARFLGGAEGLEKASEESDERVPWVGEPEVVDNTQPLILTALLIILPPTSGLLAIILALARKGRHWVIALAVVGATFGAYDLVTGTADRVDLVVVVGGVGLVLGILAGSLAWRLKRPGIVSGG